MNYHLSITATTNGHYAARRTTTRHSRVKNQESRIKNQESRIKNQESRIKNQESRIKNQESRIKNQESRIKNQESRIKNQESRIENQDAYPGKFAEMWSAQRGVRCPGGLHCRMKDEDQKTDNGWWSQLDSGVFYAAGSGCVIADLPASIKAIAEHV
ncbi:hypothetical protein FIBSPDRAFT_905340 [Athelia psychrophila]|uniref:Uncharacterized protein n=1 Tax=Athelia psychrophila TaxID=1759441 RepID=A0A167TJS3_9AGAM|nr:hypothetical protein FIBSPDRAFT_905340 [Fibularhizoctonia sp. CBS 109695]